MILIAVAALFGGLFLFKYPFWGAVGVAFAAGSNVSSFLPSVVSPIILLSLSAVLARKLLRSELSVYMPPVFLWGILLFTWHTTTILWGGAYDQIQPLHYVRLILIMLAVLWCIETPKQLIIVMAAAALGIVFSVAVTIHGLIGFFSSGALVQSEAAAGRVSEARFFGTWTDPNIMGQSIVPILALCFAFFRSRLSFWLRCLAVVTMVVGILGVLLSLSRGAMVLTATALVLMVWADKYRWVFAGMVSLMIALMLIIIPSDVVGRATSLGKGTQDRSLSQRAEMVRGGIHLIERSFPFGVGAGNIQTYSADYSLSLRKGIVAHNGYVDILVESGLIGLVLLLGAYASSARSIRIRVWRTRPGDLEQNTGIALLISLVAVVMVNIFSSYWSYDLLWFILALIAARSHVFRREPKIVLA
ncbi:O-antigen ligase family protein [bacterium]|nr:O-antigen ligase family protein [bacterium]MBU1982860.1 O-antigen ligase family protein [bacterium]